MPGSSSTPAAAASSTRCGGISRSSSAAMCPARSTAMSRKRSHCSAVSSCSSTSARCAVRSRSCTTAVMRPGRTDTAPTAPARASRRPVLSCCRSSAVSSRAFSQARPHQVCGEAPPVRGRQRGEGALACRRRRVPGHRAPPRSATRSASSASVSSVSAASPVPSTASASSCLRPQHVGDAVLDGALGDQPVHLHRPGLADAVRAVGGLRLDGRVPPAVVVHDVLGPGEVQPRARRLQRQQEDRDLARPGSGRTIASRPATGVPPCRNWVGTPRAARCRSRSRAICTYCVKTRTLASSARIVSSSSSSSSSFPERPAIRGRSSLRYCAGWLQICFSAGQQLHDQAAPGDAVGAGDLRERLAHHRLVQAGLLPGERHGAVGLGLRRQLRARCPGPTCGAAAGRGVRAGRAAPRRPGPCRPRRPAA